MDEERIRQDEREIIASFLRMKIDLGDLNIAAKAQLELAARWVESGEHAGANA